MNMYIYVLLLAGLAVASAISCYKGEGAFGYNRLNNITCASGVRLCKNVTYSKSVRCQHRERKKDPLS
jgi:hypothetical protein